MSTDGSYYEVSIHTTCDPDHGLYAVLDSAYYDDSLPVPDTTFDVDYSNQYVTTDADPINDFTEISSYYPPSPNLDEPDYSSPLNAGSPESQHSFHEQPAIYLEAPLEESVPLRPHSSPASVFGQEVPWSPDSVHSGHSVHSVPSPQSVQSYHHHTITPPPRSERGEYTPEPRFQHLTPESTPQRHRHAASLSSLQDLQNQPDLHHTQPRRYWTPIAPNPVGLRQLQGHKHSLSDDDWETNPAKRMRRASPPSPNIELTEDDNFLLRLKEDEGLTWKEIQTRFQDEMGKSFQVPALQMRLKRLRERLRVWTEADVHALRLAHESWMTSKFDIIAAKMNDYGSTEKWSPKQCSQKWQELSWMPDIYSHPMMRTPTFSTSYTASPIEGPSHGFHYPLQLPITST